MSKRDRSSAPTSHPTAKPPEKRTRTFSMLGGRLNEATTVRGAAEVVLQAADELMGWDSCALDLYFPEADTTRYVLAMDLVEGRRVETIPDDQAARPSPKFRQVISRSEEHTSE